MSLVVKYQSSPIFRNSSIQCGNIFSSFHKLDRDEICQILKIKNFNLKPLISFYNRNFLLLNEYNDQLGFVVRVSDRLGSLRVNRSEEYRNMLEARRLGFTPIEVLYFNQSNGVMLSKKIEGEFFSSILLRQEVYLKKSVAFLKKLHNSKAKFLNIFDPFQRYSSTVDHLFSLGVHPTDDVLYIHQKLKINHRFLDKSKLDLLPCHNDTSPENFLIASAEIYMIDWELSALNDPAWDLAHLSCILGLGEEEEQEIVRNYNPDNIELFLNKIIYFKPFIYMDGLVWSMFNLLMGIENLPIGKQQIENLYLDRIRKINEILDSYRYQNSLQFLTKKGAEKMSISVSSHQHKYLSKTPSVFPDFKMKVEVATCFIEHDNSVLVLKRSRKEDQSFTWGIPGGKIDPKVDSSPRSALVRELFEEIGVRFEASSFKLSAKRYARIPGWDYMLHIFHLKVSSKPNITLSEEHVEARWVPLTRFNSVKLLKGQDEAFEIVYKDTIWCRLGDINHLANVIFSKSGRLIEFDPEKRLIINLIGTSGSGKGTQGEMLSLRYGIPHISIGDLFRDELRNKTALGRLISYHDQVDPRNYSPDEICLGIMSRRLGQPDCRNGFILDGFPRTPEQTAILINTFVRPRDMHVPIFMDLSEEIIRDRLKNRFICLLCGHQVREHDETPRKGYCPKPDCKDSRLEHRVEDMDQEKLERRFGIFRENLDGILKTVSLRDQVIPLRLDGTETPEKVFSDVCSIVDGTFDRNIKSLERIPVIPRASASNYRSIVSYAPIIAVAIVAALLGYRSFANK